MVNMQKKILQIILAACMFFIGNILNAQATDPVKEANARNEKKAKAKMIDSEIAEFLVKSADARMMDAQEGKLAAKRGTTGAIRNYGALMVKDQAMLLRNIRGLAASKKISLPFGIGHQKKEGKQDLNAKAGKDFDKKFIKMMKIDHERDVRLFKKAQRYDDHEVAAFAQKYLPLIQAHLDKIVALSENN